MLHIWIVRRRKTGHLKKLELMNLHACRKKGEKMGINNMKIYDLDNVRRVKQKLDKELGQQYFFDLTQSTFLSRTDVSLNYWVVQPDEEMRIDILCYKIYGTTEFIDILLNINKIDNPLNIKSGDFIRYPGRNDIILFRVEEEAQKQTVQKLLNRNKATRKDDSRNKYIEQNYSLPPTILPTPTNAVNISGPDIIIGGGLLPS
jgi:hypothetical protein